MQASTSSSEDTSSGSSSSSGQQPPQQQTERERRPQAGPLPTKAPRLVGEIGYAEYASSLEPNNDSEDPSPEGLNAAEADARNGRHPADRSYVDLPSQSNQSGSGSTSEQSAPNPNASTSTLNTIKPPKPKSFLHKTFGGVTLKAIIRFSTLLFLLCGCIVGWVLAGLHIGKGKSSNSGSDNPVSINPIFVHMIFAVIAIVLLVFLERALFRVRAERYAHKHPGQVLPSHHQRTRRGPLGNSDAIAFAPWNRPPLPTYAAALGFRGTGDVEDAIIAAPPPPAYGNTRGSTLLLANLVRTISRRSSNRTSRSSWHQVELERRSSTRNTGPITYDESEMTEDARRAQKLADTLAQLEDGRGRNA